MSITHEAKLIYGVPFKQKKKYKFGTISFLGEGFYKVEPEIQDYLAKYGLCTASTDCPNFNEQNNYICLVEFCTNSDVSLLKKELRIPKEKQLGFKEFLAKHKIKQMPRWYLGLYNY